MLYLSESRNIGRAAFKGCLDPEWNMILGFNLGEAIKPSPDPILRPFLQVDLAAIPYNQHVRRFMRLFRLFLSLRIRSFPLSRVCQTVIPQRALITVRPASGTNHRSQIHDALSVISTSGPGCIAFRKVPKNLGYSCTAWPTLHRVVTRHYAFNVAVTDWMGLAPR